MARCSRVCGITPSSAAITSSARSMPPDAGQHVLHEALVAGHVHDLDREPVGLLEEGEAEVDRDAARLLLRQAIGVDAGEGLDQRGLAVVDVAGGADDDVRRSVASWRAAALVSASARGAPAAGRTVRQSRNRRSSSEAAEDRRVAARGAPRRAARRGARRCRGRAPRWAAPPWAARRRRPASVDSTSCAPRARCVSAARPAQDAPARAPAHRRQRLGQHRERRDGLERRPRLVGVERRLERGDRELVDAQRAVERVAASGARRARRVPTTMPACGPPRSLSPENETRSTPEATTSGTVGS